MKEYKLDHSVSGIWVMEEEGNDWPEMNRVIYGFNKVIHKRNLKGLVKVKQCRKDLVVGLERVKKDDE